MEILGWIIVIVIFGGIIGIGIYEAIKTNGLIPFLGGLLLTAMLIGLFALGIFLIIGGN